VTEPFLRSRARHPDEKAADYPPLPEPLDVAIYDNHTHLEFADGENPLDHFEQLDRASAVGVRGVVQVGTDLVTSRWSADLAAQDARVLAAVALHPNEAPDLDAAGLLDEHLAGIAELAALPRVRAIGETGLDFFRTGEEGRDAQERSFEAHVAIAKENDLALQIHDRDAHGDVLRVLRRVGAPERTVFHCFSGDAEFAREVAGEGWYLSFAGTVTFKNAGALREALEVVRRENILIETDAPYLTPAPWRGRPNSSYLMPHTLRFMAEHLGMDASTLAAQVASNTEAVYGTWD
jgi:TatD DNase family protein